MNTYNFVSNAKSVTLIADGEHAPYPKNSLIPKAILPENKEVRISSLLFPAFRMNLDVDDIQIDGVATTATTATELVDALEAIFFLGDLQGSNLIGWQDFADSNTSEASPLVQTNVNGGEVQLTNNNNDTLTDGNTTVNANTTVTGLNDLWSTTSNTIVFKDTGIEKNDIFDIRVHLNISASIISQEFNLRIDFYDDVDGGGNFVFSLREHVSTESLSAGVFRERLTNMDGFVGESILNGSAKIFLEGTKSFKVEVVGFNIKIFKIAR